MLHMKGIDKYERGSEKKAQNMISTELHKLTLHCKTIHSNTDFLYYKYVTIRGKGMQMGECKGRKRRKNSHPIHQQWLKSSFYCKEINNTTESNDVSARMRWQQYFPS